MKTTSTIIAAVLVATPAFASTVPVTVDVNSFGETVALPSFTTVINGQASGGTTQIHTGQINAGEGVLATTSFVSGGTGSDLDGGVVDVGGEFGGEGMYLQSGPTGGLGVGPLGGSPVIMAPIVDSAPKNDGQGVPIPLPGASLMGMTGLVALAATTRRRRI